MTTDRKVFVRKYKSYMMVFNHQNERISIEEFREQHGRGNVTPGNDLAELLVKEGFNLHAVRNYGKTPKAVATPKTAYHSRFDRHLKG